MNKILAIWLLCAGAAMGEGFSLSRVALMGSTAAGGTPVLSDDFEAYTQGTTIGLYQGGNAWTTAYIVHPNNTPPSLWTFDTIETYGDGVALDGLAAGVDWITVYTVHFPDRGLYAIDSMETYTDLATLNGLNAYDAIERGTNFAGAYNSH